MGIFSPPSKSTRLGLFTRGLKSRDLNCRGGGIIHHSKATIRSAFVSFSGI